MNNWWGLSNLSPDDIVRLYPAELRFFYLFFTHF